MATLRQQIATNVLTVTRFRDLMKMLRANRPNDDLEIIKKAYEYSLKVHTWSILWKWPAFWRR